MAYNKTNWKSGDIVTSEKLNKMENGIAVANNGVPLVACFFDGQKLNIRPSDIIDPNGNVTAFPIVHATNVEVEDNSISTMITPLIVHVLEVTDEDRFVYTLCALDNLRTPVFMATDRNDFFVMAEVNI